jgi:3-isopropylmalate dehydrogenase
VGREFPEVTIDDFIVDAMLAHEVRAPDRFDVIVTNNMLGVILSDSTAEKSGSLSLGGSLNAGSQHAMGRATHSSEHDINGRNLTNPFSQLLPAGLLLSCFGQHKGLSAFFQAHAAIEQALAECISAQERRRDVGGTLGNRETGQAFFLNRLSNFEYGQVHGHHNAADQST